MLYRTDTLEQIVKLSKVFDQYHELQVFATPQEKKIPKKNFVND